MTNFSLRFLIHLFFYASVNCILLICQLMIIISYTKLTSKASNVKIFYRPSSNLVALCLFYRVYEEKEEKMENLEKR